MLFQSKIVNSIQNRKLTMSRQTIRECIEKAKTIRRHRNNANRGISKQQVQPKQAKGRSFRTPVESKRYVQDLETSATLFINRPTRNTTANGNVTMEPMQSKEFSFEITSGTAESLDRDSFEFGDLPEVNQTRSSRVTCRDCSYAYVTTLCETCHVKLCCRCATSLHRHGIEDGRASGNLPRPLLPNPDWPYGTPDYREDTSSQPRMPAEPDHEDDCGEGYNEAHGDGHGENRCPPHDGYETSQEDSAQHAIERLDEGKAAREYGRQASVGTGGQRERGTRIVEGILPILHFIHLSGYKPALFLCVLFFLLSVPFAT